MLDDSSDVSPPERCSTMGRCEEGEVWYEGGEDDLFPYLPHTFILGQVCVHASSTACGRSGEQGLGRRQSTSAHISRNQIVVHTCTCILVFKNDLHSRLHTVWMSLPPVSRPINRV